MRRDTSVIGRGLLVGVVLLVAILLRPPAGEAADADVPGRFLYLKYCGACHGSGGKGDGVASGFMRPKPVDLTQLAKKAGGEFPYVPVMHAIDGTKTVRAHGDADMPVWGEIFRLESSAPVERRVEVQGKLMLITDYLRSIQER